MVPSRHQWPLRAEFGELEGSNEGLRVPAASGASPFQNRHTVPQVAELVRGG